MELFTQLFGDLPAFRELVRTKGIESPKIWEGKRGQKSTAACELDLKVRPVLDELIVGKATDYIKRAAKVGTDLSCSSVKSSQPSRPASHA